MDGHLPSKVHYITLKYKRIKSFQRTNSNGLLEINMNLTTRCYGCHQPRDAMVVINYEMLWLSSTTRCYGCHASGTQYNASLLYLSYNIYRSRSTKVPSSPTLVRLSRQDAQQAVLRINVSDMLHVYQNYTTHFWGVLTVWFLRNDGLHRGLWGLWCEVKRYEILPIGSVQKSRRSE